MGILEGSIPSHINPPLWRSHCEERSDEAISAQLGDCFAEFILCEANVLAMTTRRIGELEKSVRPLDVRVRARHSDRGDDYLRDCESDDDERISRVHISRRDELA